MTIPIKVCAVCARVLDRHTDLATGAVAYGHAGDGADHPAVPVDPDQVDQVDERCDVCGTPHPTWVQAAANFTYDATPGDGSLGDWLLCGEDARLILRGDWPRLLRHAITAFAEQHEPMDVVAQLAMADLYGQLRKHAVGLPRLREDRTT